MRREIITPIKRMSLIIFWRGAGIYQIQSTTTKDQVIHFNMLYLVGLGLADEKDITVRGLEVVKSASRVYLEAYTSILLVEKEKLVNYPHLEFVIRAMTN